MAEPRVQDCHACARDVVALRRPALIAVDGVDGSGKTTFASRLAAAIENAGRPAVIVHEDDFLAPRETRYRLGRESPLGFFRDTYDLTALAREVLDPLRAADTRLIRRRIFDHLRDTPIEAPIELVPVDGVVIVEGVFLHRAELVDRWDWSIFLDVPFSEAARRMAHRDGTPPDPEHPAMRRYVGGQQIYLATCRPRERATVVLDNSADLRGTRTANEPVTRAGVRPRREGSATNGRSGDRPWRRGCEGDR